MDENSGMISIFKEFRLNRKLIRRSI